MGFRKRRVATPGFGHVPYSPIHGEQANLRQDGTAPYCAMMQVAAEDTYDDYVICRGFDTRILKFIDYAEGDADKPGISVAKPFGKRVTGTYEIGEIYPALLPTQGNDEFAGFRQVTYVPPSPASVNWRVGQNPGVVSGGLEGGQPENLSDAITILYDHNGKVVNWLMIDGGEPAEGQILAVIELTSAMAPGIGNFADANVLVHNDPLLPETISVYNTGEATGYVGAKGLVAKIKNIEGDPEWWLLEINQFCPFYTVVLTSDTHGWSVFPHGGTTDQIEFTAATSRVLTPYPFSYIESQVIYNPFNVHGKVGDTLLVAHVEDGYLYTQGESVVDAKNIVLDVKPAIARRLFFKLDGDAPLGQAPSLSGVGEGPIGNNSGEIPDFVDPEDRFYRAHNAKTDHTGIVSYDLANGEYVVENIEHIAKRVNCTFEGSFCDTPADFAVKVVDGLDGLDPLDAYLTVDNRYSMRSGKHGDPISILWDNISGEWYPERTPKLPASIQFTITSVGTASSGPYAGKKTAAVVVQVADCELGCLIGTSVEVVDHSGCVFDLDSEDLAGVWGWASERVALSTDEGAEEGDLTPCHWSADDRCCVPADSGGGSGG